MHYFFGSGIDLLLNASDEPSKVTADLYEALNKFGASYAGNLTINAYGGFSKKQLMHLKNYKAKYARHILRYR